MFDFAEWLPWLRIAGMTAIFVMLVYGAWWGLYADRPRGRRRCPKCWYDLTYSPGMRCNECGHSAKREADFDRTRRRPIIATVALLGCATIGGLAVEGAVANGWTTHVPTRALIWGVPFARNPNGLVMGELDRRMRGGELTDAQWLMLLERSAKGDGAHRPPGDAWIDKYGRYVAIGARRRAGSVEGEERAKLDRILLAIPPRVTLETRQIWPAGAAPTVDVEARDWWPSDVAFRIRATPDIEGARPDVHLRRDAPIQRRSYSIALPTYHEAGRYEVGFDLVYERRREDTAPWEEVGGERTIVKFAVANPEDAALERVVSADLDERMQRVFRGGVVQWLDGGSLPVRIRVDAARTYSSDFDDTAIGLRVSVLRNGRLGRQLDLWWKAGVGVSDRQHAWEVPYWDDDVLAPELRTGDVWSFEVEARPELALRVKDVTKYWVGQFKLDDIRVTTMSGPAPPRGWVVDEASLALPPS